MGEQGFKARCAQLAGQRAGRCCSGSRPSSTSKQRWGDNPFRQRPALIGGVEAGDDGNAKN